MSFQQLIAEALGGDLPIVLVGSTHDAVEPLTAIAASLGMRVAKVQAEAVADLDKADFGKPDPDQPWVVLVEGCDRVAESAPADADGREPEDVLLDLAFDGDPALPSDSVVVLSFAEPTRLSDALADDEIPCVLLSPDMLAEARPSIAETVARHLGLPVFDVRTSHVDAGDLRGLPHAA